MKNSLHKFGLKLILFVVLVFAIDRGIGYIFVSLKDVGLEKNPENMWLKTPYSLEKVHTDAIVIGSSKASHHYVPRMITDSLGLSVYNCGQDGCFFVYQNYLINMILERYQPKTIIWDIQPASFYSGSKDLEYQNFRYLSPYYMSDPWAMKYIDSESDKMKYRMWSRMFAYNSKVLNYVFPLLTSGSKTDEGYIPLPNEGYKYPELKSPKASSNQKLENDYLDLLAATMQRCKDLNVNLVLFVSPVFSERNGKCSEAEIAIEQVAKEKGIMYRNYHSAPLFMGDATFFKDVEHLNDKGARVYTNLVIQDLKEII